MDAVKVDLTTTQLAADKMREGAVLLAFMPEVATVLTGGAELLESCCDTIKAQEKLILVLLARLDDDGA